MGILLPAVSQYGSSKLIVRIFGCQSAFPPLCSSLGMPKLGNQRVMPRKVVVGVIFGLLFTFLPPTKGSQHGP